MAIAHSLLGLIYIALTTSQRYQERGAMELDEAKRQRLIRHHIRRLGKLGICFSSRVQDYVTVDLRRGPRQPRDPASCGT